MRLALAGLLSALLVQESVAPVVIADKAIQPALAADADGGFYCAFIRNGNIELSTSTDGGKTWSAPVTAIDAKGKARGGMQRGPRIGVDSKKRIVVTAPLCYDQWELEKRYPKAELWIARSADGGRTFSPPLQVNAKDGTAPEALHALAVAPDGVAHVAWLDMRDREKGQDLYYAKLAEGKPGPNVKIGSTLCECCAPGLALDGKGNPSVVWRDGQSSDSRPIWISTSKDGGRTFSAPTRVNPNETRVAGCPMDAPAVAVTRDGKKTAAAWMDTRAGGNNRQVYWTMTGRPEASLADDPQGIKGHPSIAFDDRGRLHASWEDFRTGVLRIHYRGAGKDVPLSPEKGKASFPSLACGKTVGVAFEHEGRAVFVAPVSE